MIRGIGLATGGHGTSRAQAAQKDEWCPHHSMISSARISVSGDSLYGVCPSQYWTTHQEGNRMGLGNLGELARESKAVGDGKARLLLIEDAGMRETEEVWEAR